MNEETTKPGETAEAPRPESPSPPQNAAPPKPARRSPRPTSGRRALWRRLRMQALTYARRFRATVSPAPEEGRFEQPKLWLLAVVAGALSGYAALGFVWAIRGLNLLVFGADENDLAATAAGLPWTHLLLAPMIGGAIIAGLTLVFGPERMGLGVADVVEARALRHGRVDAPRGFLATIASAVTLGFGGSAGREGPAVVAAAAIAAAISGRMGLSALATRTVLGCAVAAAVSASFNAPIAGALFALEVVLGHYAIRAFAPITIASVMGAIISRSHLGDTPAFALPQIGFGSYTQFPAFLLLGLVSALAAMTLMASLILAQDAMDAARARLRAPIWAQPIVAGALVGVIALVFPGVLSVGYQTVSETLSGAYGFWTCLALICAKVAATALTLGGRMGGGVFSPALFVGALVGSAFGAVALALFPSAHGGEALYAIAGMGAVAGAVLGAPISTTLIVFELTGDYATAIAVMMATSVATAATQQGIGRSYFHLQLNRRGLNLAAGPQSFLLPTLRVRDYMRWRGAENAAPEGAAWQLVEDGAFLRLEDDLGRAFRLFRGGKLAFLPVVDDRVEGQGRTLVGALFYADALRAYNSALVAVHEEEHR